MDGSPRRGDGGDMDGVRCIGRQCRRHPSAEVESVCRVACYTPREYERNHPGQRRAADRSDPSRRGNDLRELRQPHRALPEEDARASPRPPSISRPRSATIRYLPEVAGRAELDAAIEAAGYELKPAPSDVETAADAGRSARPPTPTPPGARAYAQQILRQARRLDRRRARDHDRDVLAPDRRRRWRTSTGSMLVPATFIQFWAGRRFYAAAWRAARHGGATMDTLVAVGTTAAWALQRLRDALPGRHPRGGPPPGDVLRQLDDHHRARPARPLARGPGEGPGDRRDPAAHRPPGDVGPARPRRRGVGRAGSRRSSPATCCGSGPATSVPVDGVVVEGDVGRRRSRC